jgi:hypothetical protein
MPIYILSAMKTHAFRLMKSDQMLDEKIYQIQRFLGMSFVKVPYMFYPRIYDITNVIDLPGNQRTMGDIDAGIDWGFFSDETEATLVKPKIIAGEYKKISNGSAYLMDNGEYLNLFIGSKIPQEFAYNVSILFLIFNNFCLGPRRRNFQ